MTAKVQSECAACRAAIAFAIDSDFRSRIDIGPPSPLVFQPSIDWSTFTAPTIIDDY